MASAVAVATHPTPMEHPAKGGRRRGIRRLRWERRDSRWMQRLTAAPRGWAVGMRAAMAWHAVLPLVNGGVAAV
eukprot:4033527-Prymnesium_polylepis.1